MENGFYKKRTDYKVNIRKVIPGTKVYNHLENCYYTTDEERCYVITGTVGEKWPVNKAKLERAYDIEKYIDDIDKGIPIEVNPKESTERIFAERAQKDIEVHTSWGDVLTAHEDDIIAYAVKDNQVDKNDSWVINKDVFDTIYEKEENINIQSLENYAKKINNDKPNEIKNIDPEH